jgi:predicted ribosomally synthesized peptide with nif11-like leader
MSSVNDFDRLLGDLRTDAGLREEFEALGDDPAAWVRWGSARGYNFTPENAVKLHERFDDEISDDDLEKVAGGWCGNDTTIG